MKAEQLLDKVCYHSVRFLKRNSSTILTCIGAAGVVATAIMAAKATPKVMRLVEEAEKEKGEELTRFEVVKIAAPAYIPSVAIGASTIACIFGANVLNQKKQAALLSAYMLADNSYKSYRNKVKELLGEETDERIQEAILKDHVNEDIAAYAPGLGSLELGGEKFLFYEEIRGTYFETTMSAVLNAEYHLNRNFAMRGFVTLNEFYEFLGMSPVEFGEVLGWDVNDLAEEYESFWIDFDHHETTVAEDGLSCYIVSAVYPPKPIEEFI